MRKIVLALALLALALPVAGCGFGDLGSLGGCTFCSLKPDVQTDGWDAVQTESDTAVSPT